MLYPGEPSICDQLVPRLKSPDTRRLCTLSDELPFIYFSFYLPLPFYIAHLLYQ